MLTRIVIENFKSLRRVDLKLGPMNLFVGTNASGKSNFFDALRVLQGIGSGFTIHEILDGKPKSATSEVWDGIRGGSRNATFAGTAGPEVTLSVSGHSYLRARDQAGEQEVAWDYSITFKPEWGRVLEEKLEMGSLTYRTLPSSPGAADPQITAETLVRGTPKHLVCDRNRPVLKQLKGFDKVLDEPQIQAILAVAGHLSDIQRLDLSPSYLRTYSQAHRSKRMGERGENFAALVREILADAQLKEAYVSWLRQLRPAEVDDVKIVTGAMDDPVFMLREGNREFAAPVLSDGTLRFAAITAALFQPDMPATMLFEEIENGIHPSRLRLLVELMRSRTNDRGPQLMATTHSPTVLAWLTPEEHAHTFFCKREDDGASRICALTEVPHFREVIAKQPIGDLLTEGWLEAAL